MDRGLGASLPGTKGFTPSTGAGMTATMGRALGICLPALALIAGLIALGMAIGEPTLTGVELERPGGHVLAVDPESLAWASDIRPGQVVVAQIDA